MGEFSHKRKKTIRMITCSNGFLYKWKFIEKSAVL